MKENIFLFAERVEQVKSEENIYYFVVGYPLGRFNKVYKLGLRAYAVSAL